MYRYTRRRRIQKHRSILFVHLRRPIISEINIIGHYSNDLVPVDLFEYHNTTNLRRYSLTRPNLLSFLLEQVCYHRYVEVPRATESQCDRILYDNDIHSYCERSPYRALCQNHGIFESPYQMELDL